VQTFAPDKLTLADGKTFNITPNTSYSKLQTISAGDLKPGEFIAITAKPQPADSSLLASDVRVFPASPSARSAAQFPMDAGNLMTNAPIKSVAGNGVIVTLNNQDVLVNFAPGATISQQVAGSVSDVQPGAKVQVLTIGSGPAVAISVRG